MNKKLFYVLSVMLSILLLTPVGADAATKKKTRKKTKAKVQQTDANLNKLNNPNSACNQGGESLKSFIDKFIADKKFRKERSKLAIMGFYDEKTGKFDYFGTGPKNRERLDYDVIFSWIDEQNTWSSIFTPGKKVSRYGDCKNTTEGRWQVVEANLAVYKWELAAECAGGEGGGSMLQFTFQRKDGKWILAVVSAAG